MIERSFQLWIWTVGTWASTAGNTYKARWQVYVGAMGMISLRHHHRSGILISFLFFMYLRCSLYGPLNNSEWWTRCWSSSYRRIWFSHQLSVCTSYVTSSAGPVRMPIAACADKDWEISTWIARQNDQNVRTTSSLGGPGEQWVFSNDVMRSFSFCVLINKRQLFALVALQLWVITIRAVDLGEKISAILCPGVSG